LKLVYYVASVATLSTVFITSKRTSSVKVERPNNVKEEYRHLISIVLITKGLLVFVPNELSESGIQKSTQS